MAQMSANLPHLGLPCAVPEPTEEARVKQHFVIIYCIPQQGPFLDPAPSCVASC